jgi:thiol:disulfide interchange protein DsbD
MDPRWHTYWKNSGAAGLPTQITWQLPPGVTNGDVRWPLPEKLPDEDVTTYIYKDEVVLLVPLKLAPDLKPGPLALKADVSWLECDVSCVPGSASVNATLNVGAESKPSNDAALLSSWEKKLPVNGAGLSAHAWYEGPANGSVRPLALEWNSTATGEADFFPDAAPQFEVLGPTQRVSADSGKVRLHKQLKKLEGDWPSEISGVIVEGTGPARKGYEVKLPIASSARSGVASSSPVAAPGMGGNKPLWQTVLFAFIGGLILNLMPCVLPVIALKILGFVNQARNDSRQVRKFGLIFTLGVLTSFLILAALVLGLRVAGVSVGWGFQFKNPYFLVAMTVLVVLIALNLFGVFEVTAGGRALNAAATLSSEHGAAGAFFNGLFATLLATSCSAPILAGAVGFAFAHSGPVLILILLTVGAGLSAPYLVLSWKPSWLKFVPKPGPWMERFKIAMGFPMLAAGVWLCSLLTIHYGERAWWLAVFLVFVAVAAWVYGEFVQRGRQHRGAAAVVALAVLLGGYFYALEAELNWREPLAAGAQAGAPKEAPKGLAWQPWSPQAVADARAQGRPVLVDFTAKWCLTCNTVIKPVLESVSVQNKLKEINAVPLLANYTLQPPEMTEALKSFGRAAVPLVVVYPRDSNAPPMVFDLVTPSDVVRALDIADK